MARFHALALAQNSRTVLGKMLLTAVGAALVPSCATMPWSPGNGEAGLADPSLIHLETSQFLWVDARQREQLACANGTAVICTGGHSRLSLSHCGCLADDD